MISDLEEDGQGDDILADAVLMVLEEVVHLAVLNHLRAICILAEIKEKLFVADLMSITSCELVLVTDEDVEVVCVDLLRQAICYHFNHIFIGFRVKHVSDHFFQLTLILLRLEVSIPRVHELNLCKGEQSRVIEELFDLGTLKRVLSQGLLLKGLVHCGHCVKLAILGPLSAWADNRRCRGVESACRGLGNREHSIAELASSLQSFSLPIFVSLLLLDT